MALLLLRATPALVAAVLIALGMTEPAGAQDSGGYVGGAAMLSTQRGHRQGSAPSLPTTGAGGTAIGVTVESGVRLTRRIAIGAELSLPRRFTSVQDTNYLRVFQHESRHRDLALSGIVRAIIGPARRVRLGLVGGGGLVQEHTRQRRRDQAGPFPTFPPIFGPYSGTYSFTRWTVAAVAGADVEIDVAPRVAIVPQLRAHFVRRNSDGTEPGWVLGLNALVVRPAIGVRLAF
jgi:hypothetical protein